MDPVGSYRVEIPREDAAAIAGTLDIWRNALGKAHAASIHIDADGSGFELPLVVVEGSRVRIVGFTVGQLLELDFRLSDDGSGSGTAMVGEMRPLRVSRREN